MLKTFQSSSAAERLGAASAFVERFSTATEVLIVGASRDAADDLARRVTAARRATFGLHRASLTQLAVRFAAEEMARLGVAPATALGAEAVTARVSFEALREQALAYFAPVARFPGFARALAAYRRYALEATRGTSYLATYRALARKYPQKRPEELLGDLVASTPGDEGKWSPRRRRWGSSTRRSGSRSRRHAIRRR